MHKRLVFITIFILYCISSYSQGKINIHGFVKDSLSEETLLNASVYNTSDQTGCITNGYGFYSMEINRSDSVSIEFSYVGYKKKKINIYLNRDTCINVFLTQDELAGIDVVDEGSKNKLSNLKPGLIKIDSKSLQNSVALFGEHDALNYLQTLPGITNSTDANNNFSVRGGGPDQNLIVLDDAPLYSTNHLLGYFSNVNEDIIKNIDVWKGSYPAKFGGKLSSVIDVRTKDGDENKYHLSLGLGVIASKILSEGPLIKDKSSFIFAMRRSNLDFSLPLLMSDFVDYSRYHFTDVNFKINYRINNNNRVFYSGYYGMDKFTKPNQRNDNFLKWHNITSSMRWNHIFNSKVFSNTSIVYSKFYLEDLTTADNANHVYFKYVSQIEGVALRIDLEWYPASKLEIKSGFDYDIQFIKPNAIWSAGIPINDNIILNSPIYNITNIAIYLEMNYSFSKQFNIILGDRFSTFLLSNTGSNLNEPRITANYKVTDKFYLFSSYSKTSQSIHLLSNTGLGTPSDMWVPSTEKFPIEIGNQVALGFKTEFQRIHSILTMETYYKKLTNIVGYKPGSIFLSISDDPSKIMIPDWQQNITQGKSNSYGTELLFNINNKNFSCFVGYTLAWVLQKFSEINNGNEFYAPYDRRHKININNTYNFRRDKSRKELISVSCNWTYTSGRPITLPYSYYSVHSINWGQGGTTTEYGPYNGFRLKDYHRLDLAFKFSKVKKHSKRIWEIGVYNLYNRLNPYKYTLDERKDPVGNTKAVLVQM